MTAFDELFDDSCAAELDALHGEYAQYHPVGMESWYTLRVMVRNPLVKPDNGQMAVQSVRSIEVQIYKGRASIGGAQLAGWTQPRPGDELLRDREIVASEPQQVGWRLKELIGEESSCWIARFERATIDRLGR